MWEAHDGMGWWMVMGGAFWILLIGTLLYLLLNSAWRSSGAPTSGPATPESPLDILKRRYAQGELSDEDFERMRRTLEQGTNEGRRGQP